MKPLKVALVAACAVVVGWAFTASAAYVPVEWIKANGKQWIYTGYVPKCTDKVEIKIKTDTVGTTHGLWCSRGATTSTATFTGFLSSTKKFLFHRNANKNNNYSDDAVLANTDYVVTADGNTLVCTVNGKDVSAKMESGTFTPSNAFSLFATYSATSFDPANPPTMDNFGTYTLYYFRVYDKDGNLVRQYIPARDDSVSSGTAQYGLYESVTKTFYPGLGSGSFSAGPGGGRRINPETGIVECSLSVDFDSAGGSVTVDEAPIEPGNQIWGPLGSVWTVTLKAEPKSGYRFVCWDGDTKSIAPEDLTKQEISYSYNPPCSLRAVFVGESAITASAYVQDGLLAQWDGIENAGVGTHDPAATTWADLKGENNLTLTKVTFGENCATFASGKAIGAQKYTLENGLTFEVYAKPTAATGDMLSFQSTSTSSGFNFYGYSSQYRPYDGSKASFAKNETAGMSVVVSEDGLSHSFYKNGAYVEAKSYASREYRDLFVSLGVLRNLTSGRTLWNGSMYAVRVYNRALKPEEIALNAGVDQARFGLNPEDYRWNAETGKIEMYACVSAVDGAEVSADGGETWGTSVREWVERGAQVTVKVRVPDGAHIYLMDPEGVLSDDGTTATLTITSAQPNVIKAGATITWQNGSDKASNYWDDETQWKDEYGVNRLPAACDNVVIPNQSAYPYSGSTIIVTNTTPRFKKVWIGRGRFVSMRNWMTQFRAGEVILNGDSARAATITCGSGYATGAMSNRVWIVADRLALSNSYASVSASGYAKKHGPGWEGIASPSGGGAHGGKAYSGNCQTYGSITEPTAPGTGTWSDNNDGHGGGAIRIEVGELLVNGSISTPAGKNLYGGGNGSGGSVWITCETISGTGTVSANGGGKEDATLCGSNGGGGGRVSVNYNPEKQALVDCQVAFSARGGLERSSTSYARYNTCGNCGTLYFTDDIFLRRPTMKLAGIVYYGPDVTPVSSFTGESRTLENTWLVITNDNAEVNFTGDLTLKGTSAKMNGVQLTGQHTTVNIGGNLSCSGAQLRVDGGDSVSIAGNVVLEDGASAVNSGELNFRAAPTNENGVAARPLTIGGDFILNSYGGYIPRCDPTNGAIVKLVVRNMSVCSNATVYGDQSGFNATGRGPGFPTGWTRGASHGGRGGTTNGGAYGGTKPYDDRKRPCMPGSSGRNSGNTGSGTGGGVVFIETLGRLIIDGTITATGSAGGAYYGGSSGGAVQIRCNGKLSGTGSISANGGNMTSDSGAWGGAGGGGRIAVWYANLDECSTLVESTRAAGGAGAGTVEGREGEDGTVYWHPIKGLMIFVR